MVVAVVAAAVVVVAGLRVLLRDKSDRLARRELRRLRWRERSPNLRAAREHRYDMMMDPMPGKHHHPHGP
ncbi:hypothetical protein JCM33774_29710 [Actinophytocola sp. KF-1]